MSNNNNNNNNNIALNVSYNTLKETAKKIGYLKKLGGKGISKNWRKRFFILTQKGFLYYFKHRTSSTPVGALNLEKYTKIYKDVNKKKNFMLINENDPSQRVFHLVSETEQEMSEWIEAITDFFQTDVSDLQNQLNDLKLKKQDTISRKKGIQVKKVEEYELDNLQLVLRGGRLSISVKTGSADIPSLLTITSPSLGDSPLQKDSPKFDQIPLDRIELTSSSSFLKINKQFINPTTITTTNPTETLPPPPPTYEESAVGFHDDDDDEDDECDE